MDSGEFRDGDRAAFLDTLDRWDRIFGVLEDNDHEKLVRFGFKPLTVEAADRIDFTDSARVVVGNGHRGAATELMTDEEIARSVAERDEVRRQGNFARADEIRRNLQKAGVILEDGKLGTRWKRK